MAYHVIFVASGLSEGDAARAGTAGPPHVSATESYLDLLASAGFGKIDELDLTDQYRLTAQAWLNGSTRAASQLEAIFGVEEFRQRQQEREEDLAAIEDGLLRRSLFTAHAVARPLPLRGSAIAQVGPEGVLCTDPNLDGHDVIEYLEELGS